MEVEGFPANVTCPEGVAAADWDDDGDRWGRDILALADGRFLVVWVVAGDRSQPSAGIHCCISNDGKTWDASAAVTLLPDTMVGEERTPLVSGFAAQDDPALSAELAAASRRQ